MIVTILKTTLKKHIDPTLWSFLRWYYQTFGLKNIPIGLFRFVISNELVRVRIPGTSLKVYIRPATTDMSVFTQIFHDQELNIKMGKANVIVDAGAHIGLSSIWYALRFPDAHIIAIEPEPNNYSILKKNTVIFKNIIALEGALWYREKPLKIKEGCKDTWGFRVEETSDKNGIQSFTMNDIMNHLVYKKIDVLKMDIEGSEVEVLSNSNIWVNSIDLILIEHHERFRPGCLKAINDAISNYSFTISKSGEKLILRNMNRIFTSL